MAVKSFQRALRPGIELRTDLVRFPVVTIKALMARVNQFIRAEEDDARGRENFGLHQEDWPSKKDKKSSKREESDQHRAPLSQPGPELR